MTIKNQFYSPLNLIINKPWKIISIFSFIGLFAILNHAMWRDEMNTWLIVRDSESFLDMVGNVNYQGHPLLWAISLSFLFNFVQNPLVMQLFHLFLAITAMLIFWQFSPFNFRQKLLFSFSYLPFYEYLVISRVYVYGMLFLWGFCALFNTRKKSYLLLAIILGLMANSNAYALLVSGSLALMLFFEFCFDHKLRREYWKNAPKYDFILSFLVLILLYFLSVYIIAPPVDSANHGGQDGFFFAFELKRFLIALGKLFSAYTLIIPKKQWLDLIICSFLGLILFIILSFKLLKKPFPLFFFIFATFSIISFSYFRFILADFRHFGHCYLILIASFWLSSYYQDNPLPNPLPRVKGVISNLNFSQFLLRNKKFFNFFKKVCSSIFMLILYLHFVGGIYGLTRDLIIPFSASRETANYIKENNLENEFIIASEDSKMAALAGYLNRKFYYPELQKMGSFTLFIQERKLVSQEDILTQTREILQDKTNLKRVLLILNSELKITDNMLNITPIKKFTNSFNSDERHYLYWLELSPLISLNVH